MPQRYYCDRCGEEIGIDDVDYICNNCRVGDAYCPDCGKIGHFDLATLIMTCLNPKCRTINKIEYRGKSEGGGKREGIK